MNLSHFNLDFATLPQQCSQAILKKRYISIRKSLLLLITMMSVQLKGAHYLSFVMPCFNAEETIRESIDSIYLQTNLRIPFEVICTDDGSTDGTLAVLREYEAKYENFHVVIHEKNRGGGAANNTCVDHAKGDLLFRLDTDNILMPNSVQGLVDLLDTTGADGAAFQEKRFFKRDTAGNKIHVGSWFYEPQNNICNLRHALSTILNPLHSGNYLYTRKSFERAGGYPMQRSGTDTHCFGLKQYMTGSKIAILPKTYYLHLQNQNGYYVREAKAGRNNRALWRTLKEYREIFDEKTRKFLDSVDENIAMFDEAFNGRLVLISDQALEALWKANDLLESNDIATAIKYYEKAIEYGCSSQKVIKKINELKMNRQTQE